MYVTYGAAPAEGISVAGATPSNAVHDAYDLTASFSMPVQYSMAAPAVASAKLAAASLTSVSPSYKIISTTQQPLFASLQSGWIPKPFVQHSQPSPNLAISGQTKNRRMAFSAGYFASEPLFDSHNEYGPEYHQVSPPHPTYQHVKNTKIHQSYASPYQPHVSYTPPPSYEQYHQPPVYPKPYFLNHVSHYNHHDHNFIDFPVHSYKGDLGSSSSSYYKVLFPLALLGISIPAIGLMYTYLSRRRRRDLNSDYSNYLLPAADDLQYYLDILQSSIHRFQESMNNELSVND